MKKYILSFIAIAMLFSSCSKDWLTTNPKESGQVPTAEADLEKITNGVYYTMYNAGSGQDYVGEAAYGFMNDLIGGNISMYSASPNDSYSTAYSNQSELQSDSNNFRSSFVWSISYQIIFRINMGLIFGDAVNPESLTSAQKVNHDRCMAELYTLRAFMYHRLNSTYSFPWAASGDNTEASVPLIVTLNFNEEPRNSREDVVAQIEADLKKATDLFTSVDKKPSTRTLQVRATANSLVLEVLKARFYMYKHEYTKAFTAAKIVADATTPMSSEDYLSGFNKIGQSWIFAAPYTDANQQGFSSPWAVYASNHAQTKTYNCPFSIDISLFDGLGEKDSRRLAFIKETTPGDISSNLAANPDYYYELGIYFSKINPGTSTKYRQLSTGTVNGDGDIMYMRGEEAYYLAAEAAYEAGDAGNAKLYLEKINNVYDEDYAAPAGDALLADIIKYKKFDMFMEGRSFEDAKRRGTNVVRGDVGHPSELANNSRKYSPELLPRIMTFMVPKSAMEYNRNLTPNDYK